jgi:predicted secreted acid phosphatase
VTETTLKQPAIIVDLDGTLCNADHRRHHVESKPKNWKAFYDGMVDDHINAWCVRLVNAMASKGYQVLFVTGRPDNYRKQTEDWIAPRLWSGSPIFMRKEGDYRQDSIVKTQIYKEAIEPHYDVLFCIDDRKQVVDAWRALGLVCLQCAEGNF